MMRIKLSITRRELADKDYDDAKIEITGDRKDLPDEAERIAELIKNILTKREVKNYEEDPK